MDDWISGSATFRIEADAFPALSFKKNLELILAKSEVSSGNRQRGALFTTAHVALKPRFSTARLFMILVAIFSIIVLLLCFLCYSGDCNN
jgi:hypothetical protein